MLVIVSAVNEPMSETSKKKSGFIYGFFVSTFSVNLFDMS